MKFIVYSFAFTVALVIIFFGLYNHDEAVIQSGASLFFFILMAFIGSSIAEVKKLNIGVKTLRYIVSLFVISIGILVYGACINHIIIAAAIALALGVLSIAIILSREKRPLN